MLDRCRRRVSLESCQQSELQRTPQYDARHTANHVISCLPTPRKLPHLNAPPCPEKDLPEINPAKFSNRILKPLWTIRWLHYKYLKYLYNSDVNINALKYNVDTYYIICYMVILYYKCLIRIDHNQALIIIDNYQTIMYIMNCFYCMQFKYLLLLILIIINPPNI